MMVLFADVHGLIRIGIIGLLAASVQHIWHESCFGEATLLPVFVLLASINLIQSGTLCLNSPSLAIIALEYFLRTFTAVLIGLSFSQCALLVWFDRLSCRQAVEILRLYVVVTAMFLWVCYAIEWRMNICVAFFDLRWCPSKEKFILRRRVLRLGQGWFSETALTAATHLDFICNQSDAWLALQIVMSCRRNGHRKWIFTCVINDVALVVKIRSRRRITVLFTRFTLLDQSRLVLVKSYLIRCYILLLLKLILCCSGGSPLVVLGTIFSSLRVGCCQFNVGGLGKWGGRANAKSFGTVSGGTIARDSDHATACVVLLLGLLSICTTNSWFKLIVLL